MAASLSPETRAPPTHRRGLDLLRNTIDRLERGGFDHRDAIPESAFRNDFYSEEEINAYVYNSDDDREDALNGFADAFDSSFSEWR